MRRTRSVLSSAALLLVLTGALSACGDDDPPDAPTASDTPTPTPTPNPEQTPSESPTADAVPALCAAVSDEQLSDLAGRPLAATTQTEAEGVTECAAVSDDNALAMTWQTQPAPASLDEAVDAVEAAAPDGLERSEVSVAGQPGALLAGDSTGKRSAKVVVLLGAQSLYVDLAYLDGVGPEASTAALRRLALGVAELAAAGLA